MENCRRRNWALVRAYYCRSNDSDGQLMKDEDKVAMQAVKDDDDDDLELIEEDDDSSSYTTSLPESNGGRDASYPVVLTYVKRSGSSYGSPGTSDRSPTSSSGDNASVSSASVAEMMIGRSDDPPLPVRSKKKKKKKKNGKTMTWNERIFRHFLLPRPNEPKIKRNEDQRNRKSVVDVLPGSLLRLFGKSSTSFEKETESKFKNGCEDQTIVLDGVVSLRDDASNEEEDDDSIDENFWSDSEFDEDDDDLYANADGFGFEKEEMMEEEMNREEAKEKSEKLEKDGVQGVEEQKKPGMREEVSIETIKTTQKNESKTRNGRPGIISSKPLWNGNEKSLSTRNSDTSCKTIPTAYCKKDDSASNRSLLDKTDTSTGCTSSSDGRSTAASSTVARQTSSAGDCSEKLECVSSSASFTTREKLNAAEDFHGKKMTSVGSGWARNKDRVLKPEPKPKGCYKKAVKPSVSVGLNATDNHDNGRTLISGGIDDEASNKKPKSAVISTLNIRRAESENAASVNYCRNNIRCQKEKEKANYTIQSRPAVFPIGAKTTLSQSSSTKLGNASSPGSGTRASIKTCGDSGKTSKICPPAVPDKPGAQGRNRGKNSGESDGRFGCATATDFQTSVVGKTFDETAFSSLHDIESQKNDEFHRLPNIREIVELFDGEDVLRIKGIKPSGRTASTNENNKTTAIKVIQRGETICSNETGGNQMSSENVVDAKKPVVPTSKTPFNRTKSASIQAMPATAVVEPSRKVSGRMSTDNSEFATPTLSARWPLPVPPAAGRR